MKQFLLIISLFLVISFTQTSCGEDTVTEVITTDTLLLAVDTAFLSPLADATIFDTIRTANNNSTAAFDSAYASGASKVIRVGASTQNGFKARTLLKFDLSRLPANAEIIGAQLNLFVARLGGNAPVLSIHKLTEDWEEGSMNDNCEAQCSQPGILIDEISNGGATWRYSTFNTTEWSTPGGAYESIPSAVSTDRSSSLTTYNTTGITNDLKSWVEDESTNFGWIIKGDFNREDSGQLIRYFSNEGGAGVGNKPKLVVYYSLKN